MNGMQSTWKVLLLVGIIFISGCSDDESSMENSTDVYAVAQGCYAVALRQPSESESFYVRVSDSGMDFAFDGADPAQASRFFFKPSDLATYLLYDDTGFYLTADDNGMLERKDQLMSDIMLIEDGFLPGAQWVLEPSENDASAFQFKHLKSGQYMSRTGLQVDARDAAIVTLEAQGGCAAHPELTLDAEGLPTKFTWEDGSVYGFAEPHTHLLTNFGFGGGGVFHGAPFHPLGVEHALLSCELFHGPEGRKDLLGIGVADQANLESLISIILSGQAEEPVHVTAGYPDFTDWPNAPTDKTHQTQYYQWIKRAYLGGLRLMVQHGTSHEVLCELMEGFGLQDVRYSCNDMVAIDRQLDEARRLERYIDAHEGGPGKGWFRIVESPAEARQVIADGKLAVVLGIEVSNLFNCLLNPKDGSPRCYESDVIAALDAYEAKGVRVLFPNHKTDNLFTPGDGSRGIFELANFVQTGNWSNFVEDDCPNQEVVFDKGALQFGNLNMPRSDYLAAPAVDMSGFKDSPLETLLPFIGALLPKRVEGHFCQNGGLTNIGEFLFMEMMRRGLVIEIDHLPQKSYVQAFELLEMYNYPAVGTHGRNNDGRLYELGGLSVQTFDRCRSPNRPRDASREQRHALIAAAGGLPAEPMSFDMNGLASPPKGRFSDTHPCNHPQANPVMYPFTSHAGDVTFTQPRVGNRVLDFNKEGLVHLGLLPELVEDLRVDGVSQESIDSLFKSAEAYLQMWERAEQRGREIRQSGI